MTDPRPNPPPLEITYASPPARISRLRQQTWKTLLIKGVLSIFAGGLTILDALTLTAMTRSSSARPAPSVPWTEFLLVFPLGLSFLAIGITEILCSIKLRRKSTTATIVVLILQCLQFAVVLLIMGFALAGASARQIEEGAAGLVVYGVIELAFGVLISLLIKLLREPRNLV